jgi:hypothetical protein
MPNFLPTLGGSKGRSSQGPYIVNMVFQHNTIIKTNDWYHKPHNRASWSRSTNRAIANYRNSRI